MLVLGVYLVDQRVFGYVETLRFQLPILDFPSLSSTHPFRTDKLAASLFEYCGIAENVNTSTLLGHINKAI